MHDHRRRSTAEPLTFDKSRGCPMKQLIMEMSLSSPLTKSALDTSGLV